ncbi:TetR/AcrR family transcriptional regulator [Sphingomonas sp. MMS24-JH45]
MLRSARSSIVDPSGNVTIEGRLLATSEDATRNEPRIGRGGRAAIRLLPQTNERGVASGEDRAPIDVKGIRPAHEAIAATDRFPRRTARRRQTRARILDAAFREFQRVGYADATMNAIADAADIHVTTLFTHFKAKRELAKTLAENELVRLEELIRDAKGKVPFFRFLRELVVTVAGYRQDKGDHKRGIDRKSLNEPELALHWLRYAEREVTLFAGYIAADFGLDPPITVRRCRPRSWWRAGCNPIPAGAAATARSTSSPKRAPHSTSPNGWRARSCLIHPVE